MTRLATLAALLLLLLQPAAAWAQAVVTSPRPESVDVTIYRDPDRSASQGFDREWLGGYSLVSETRRISLPAGESEVRFEGVAAGMIPQSVIVSGLPEALVERNRDALLLSPATLVDRSLGRRVTIRRTSLETGATRDMEAVIRTGAEGAVVLQTADGFEALRCTGLPETLEYEQVPPGLSARPTLSIRVRARQAVTATVTISYLASGFDWQANYIVSLDSTADRADFFAWLTLASNDETSFVNADAQVVAGEINQRDVPRQEVEGPPLELRCWPQLTTSDIPLTRFERMAPPPPPSAPPAVYESGGESIVVTGSRIRRNNLESFSPLVTLDAVQEDLGAVKLYRIPEPVTVASNGQKQVGLLRRNDVDIDIVYRQYFGPDDAPSTEAAPALLMTRNVRESGLGLPLPAGNLIIYADGPNGPFLLGEASLADRAIGDEVEIELEGAPGVIGAFRQVGERDGDGWRYELRVTNDRPWPIVYEAHLSFARMSSDTRLGRRNGRPVWRVTVPANGSAVLRFRAR